MSTNDATSPSLASGTAVWIVAAVALTALAVLSLKLGVLAIGGLAAVAFFAWAWRRPEILLIALMATASLDTMGRLATVAGVQLTFYQVVVAASVLLLAGLVLSGKVRARRTPVDLWVGLFAAAAAISVLGAENPKRAIVALASLYSSLAMVYLVAWIADTPKRLRTALVGLLLVAAGLGAIAVIERLGIFSLQGFYKTFADGIRARATFDDPNTLGGVLGIGAALGFALAAAERKLWPSLFYWALTGMALVGLVATLSRGAMLGFFVGAVVAVFTAPMPVRRRVGLIVAGFLGVVAMFTVVLDPAWIAKKVVGIFEENSAMARVVLARSGMRMFADRPWGIGLGNWKLVFPAYRDPHLQTGLLESHTTYVTVLVETGVMGLVGLVATLVVSAYSVVRTAYRAASYEVRTLAAAVASSAAVAVIQSFTYSTETSKFLWFMIGAAIAAASMFSIQTEDSNDLAER